MELPVKEKVFVHGKIRAIKSINGKVISISPWYDNLVMNGTDTGINLFLKRLDGTNTYSLNINYADLGSSGTAPTISDTQLNTPVSRTNKANSAIVGSVLSLYFFWPDANLANGTYREFGAFIDGTATISTGKIFEHALFGTPYTKASGEDTTIQLDITIA